MGGRGVKSFSQLSSEKISRTKQVEELMDGSSFETDYTKRELKLREAIREAWKQYKRQRTRENYAKTVGALIESLSPDGKIKTEYRAFPRAKELLAAQALASNGHTIVFLPQAGEGKHPDATIDGVLADFKRIESSNSGKVYQRIKEGAVKADMIVVDLSLDSITVKDAAKKAEEAINDGIVKKGNVIILDRHGKETKK